MKRFVLFFCIALAMVRCKKDEEKPVTVKVETKTNKVASIKADVECGDSDIIKKLVELDNIEAVNEWLGQNGHLICEQGLTTCIQDFHEIDFKKFMELAHLHMENPVGSAFKPYDQTWEDVKKVTDKISCYEAYVKFIFTGTQVKLDTIKKFTLRESCYSKPLFDGLQNKYHLKNDDIFTFVKSIGTDEDGNEVLNVIFKLKIKQTGEVHYFDISDWPGFE